MSTIATTVLKSIRTSAVTLPRQLAPTVGQGPSKVIFRAGSLPAGCDGDFAVGQAIVFGNLFFVENAGYRPATAPPATRAIIMPFGRINAFVGLVEAMEEPLESTGSLGHTEQIAKTEVIGEFQNFWSSPRQTAIIGDSTVLALHESEDLEDDAESIQRAPSTVSPSEPESILRALN